MALGNTQQSTGNLFILKFVTKDKDKKTIPASFSVSKKVDKKYEVVDTVNKVTGNLYKIEIKENKWKDETYNTVSIFLKDGEEAYLLDFRFSLPTRSFFNSLLSLESFDNLEVTAYDGKNGYAAIGTWQDRKLVKWKYKLDELPSPTTVRFKGKDMNDYSEVDNFFIKELEILSAKLGASKGKKSAAKSSAPAASSENQSENTDTPDEDVPF